MCWKSSKLLASLTNALGPVLHGGQAEVVESQNSYVSCFEENSLVFAAFL